MEDLERLLKEQELEDLKVSRGPFEKLKCHKCAVMVLEVVQDVKRFYILCIFIGFLKISK